MDALDIIDMDLFESILLGQFNRKIMIIKIILIIIKDNTYCFDLPCFHTMSNIDMLEFTTSIFKRVDKQ